MKKKKKKSSIPRHKRLSRQGRLIAARDSWLPKYTSKKILSSYKKHFAVDTICALTELEILGIEFDPKYKEQLIRSEERRIELKQERKLQKKSEQLEIYDPEMNDTFLLYCWAYA